MAQDAKPKPRTFALACYSDEQLRNELDRRARAAGKPATQWIGKRSEYLRKTAAELQAQLDELLEDRVPAGQMLAVKRARVRSLEDRINKNLRYAKLAEAEGN
ncbi:hypothetical protein [Stenotrophomonas sp. NLF4-10]|uniref:hypothetical protein n=1 Tax=Stenotrophomonas sp. NLF4-10 TaxID=2918754 RepID=UPI001EFB9D5F|nr:hypothetical protein [Stenotrophomonas sp. NLF4-10]MCG8275384.1 hypothetical protein [Stenotrophomonas sp. NLF4-10]